MSTEAGQAHPVSTDSRFLGRVELPRISQPPTYALGRLKSPRAQTFVRCRGGPAVIASRTISLTERLLAESAAPFTAGPDTQGVGCHRTPRSDPKQQRAQSPEFAEVSCGCCNSPLSRVCGLWLRWACKGHVASRRTPKRQRPPMPWVWEGWNQQETRVGVWEVFAG